MIIEPLKPIAAMHGKVLGKNNGYHVRTNRRGLVYSARSGNPMKHPSEAQLRQQEKIRQTNTRVHSILQDPAQRAAYEEAFRQQDRCKRLRDYVFSCEMRICY